MIVLYGKESFFRLNPRTLYIYTSYFTLSSFLCLILSSTFLVLVYSISYIALRYYFFSSLPLNNPNGQLMSYRYLGSGIILYIIRSAFMCCQFD